MRIEISVNRSPFTARSLTPIVRLAFERVGIVGEIALVFDRSNTSRVAAGFRRGHVIRAPFGEDKGNVVVDQGKHLSLRVSRKATVADVYRAARWAGWQMRGASPREATARYGEPLGPGVGGLELKPKAEPKGRAKKPRPSHRERLEGRLRRVLAAHGRAERRLLWAQRSERRLAKKAASINRSLERAIAAELGKVEP